MSATDSSRSRTRNRGLLFAAGTAVISGVAVFTNGYGVRAWAEVSDPTTFTTFKNAMAALILVGAALLVGRRDPTRALRLGELKRSPFGVIAVVLLGGSIPFVLFFEGLARATSSDAAFIHKTLFIWVAILAVIFLHERLGWLQLGALALLAWGQVALAGGVDGLTTGPGEWMILAATLLWAIETVVAKNLLGSMPPLTLAVARMGGGVVVLVVYGVARGAFGDLTGLGPEHVLWILVTGITLAGYVGTWYAALSRAPAVDVTAVLVGGAMITALLETGIRGTELPSLTGLVLVALGVALLLTRWRIPVTAHE